VDEDKVEASFNNDVLKVSLPKPPRCEIMMPRSVGT